MSATALTLDSVRAVVNKYRKTITEDQLKEVEELLIAYGKQLAQEKNIAGLEKLMVEARPLYEVVGKAKAAKLVRSLVDLCLTIDQAPEEKVSLVKNCIQWSNENKREFLRRTLEARLIRLLNDQAKYLEAMKIAGPLVSQLKKIEDRELLMEVTLEESRSAFALKNYAKAKTSLVLAKTSANGAYVSTSMQAGIDLHSGILYSADEKDYKTAYSYCYEALEGYQACGEHQNAVRALKYMILCKVMSNESKQVPQLMATKVCSSAKGKEIDAMIKMAEAFTKRSLVAFQECLDEYQKELLEDPVVSTHSKQLHTTMLEKEISRVIEPYSEVQLEHIVKKVGLPPLVVEKTIAMMILDKKVHGYIDQRIGSVRIFPNQPVDKAYVKSANLVKQLAKTVEATVARTLKIK